MAMNRALPVIGIFVVIAVVVVALWTARTPSARRSNQESLQETMRSAITNPVAFAKNRFTGGVGAALGTDPATGALLIMKIMAVHLLKRQVCAKEIIFAGGWYRDPRTNAGQNVESIRGSARAA